MEEKKQTRSSSGAAINGAAAEEEKEEDEDEEKRGWQGPSAASGMSREAPQEVGEVASRSKTSSQNK